MFQELKQLYYTIQTFKAWKGEALENIVGKGQKVGNQNFLFFSCNVFYPNTDKTHRSSNILHVVCKSFHIWKGQNFVVS